MTDPLAHLYAETGVGLDDDVELGVTETSFDELHAERGREEELSDGDVAELALLVKERITTGGLTDDDAAELGLGDVRDLDGTLELVLNDVGRQVVRHLIAEDFPLMTFGGGSR